MNVSKNALRDVHAVRLWLGWLAALACTLCCLAPRSSRADEEKTYAGASCHPNVMDMAAGLPGAPDQSGRFSAQAGSIKNISGGDGTVDCPIVKSVASDGNLTAVKVFVDFGTVTGTASCTLGVYSSTTQASGPLPFTTMRSTSGQHIQTISFPSISGLPMAWGPTWSYYMLTCTLPAGAAIRSYYVNESGTRSDTQKTYAPAGCTISEYDSCAEVHGDSVLEPNREDNCPIDGQVQLICPVVTDNKSNTGGLDLELSFVRPGYTQAFVHRGQCTLYNTNASGTTLFSDTLDLSADPNEAGGTVRSWLFHVDGGGAFSKYFLQCSMEGLGDARLISYRTTEHGAGEAVNADSKGYPGSLCSTNPYTGITHPDRSVIYVYHGEDGTITNGDSHAVSDVWCPIIGDHVNTPNGIGAVRVNLLEGGSALDVTSCTVDAYSQTSTTPFASTSASVPASKNGLNYTLPISAVGGGVTAPVYVLHCALSRGTILRNYEVDEK